MSARHGKLGDIPSNPHRKLSSLRDPVGNIPSMSLRRKAQLSVPEKGKKMAQKTFLTELLCPKLRHLERSAIGDIKEIVNCGNVLIGTRKIGAILLL